MEKSKFHFEPFENIEEAISLLNSGIIFSENCGEPLDTASYEYSEGVLITRNHAIYIVEQLKKFQQLSGTY